MKKLTKPRVSVSDVVASFASGPKIDRVHANSVSLAAIEAVYDHQGTTAQLIFMPHPPAGMSNADAAVVSWSYEAHFRSRKGGGRSVYSSLRNSTGVCPICRLRDIGALDHHLPRESYPGLAIQPSNLVPICVVCNYAKLQEVASTPGDQFLHPYFDDLGGDEWLLAEVLEEPGAPVVYSVAPLSHWSPQLHDRVLAHMERFALSRHYADKAATRLGGYRKFLATRLANQGAVAVSDYLFELGDSVRENGAEPWIAAAMNSWGASEWFCNGGWVV